MVTRGTPCAQPKDIFERLTKEPDEVQKRPLLAGDDPLAKLEALMADRRNQYEQVCQRQKRVVTILSVSLWSKSWLCHACQFSP